MHEERFTRFMNKASYDETEKVVKAFLEEYSSVGLPVYLLDEEGNVDGRLFLSTQYSETTIRSKIKKIVGPEFRIKVKPGQCCYPSVIYSGFWIDIEERKEKNT